MGFLTTLTIYNDGIHLLEPHAQEFAREVYRIAAGLQPAQDIALGGFVNAVHVQRSRHADATTIYVHAGNCVTEMNGFAESTVELLQRNPQFFKKLTDEVSRQARLLRFMYKEHAARQKKEQA